MKVKKTATMAARQAEAPPEVRDIVGELSNKPFPQLAVHLDEFTASWDRPRADLYLWAPLLDRFDDELQKVVSRHRLMDNSDEIALLSHQEEETVVSILNFSRVLIEHGSNRGIYSSVPEVIALLRVVNSKVIASVLKVLLKIAIRYAPVARHNRPKPLRQIPEHILAQYAQLIPVQASGKLIELYEFASPGYIFSPDSGGINYEYMHEGAFRKLTMSPKTVQEHTLENIWRRIKEETPKNVWFDALNIARVAKAISGDMYLRRALVGIQCYAVGVATLLLPPRDFRREIFCKSPQTFKLVASLITPENEHQAQNEGGVEVPDDLRILGLDVLLNIFHEYNEFSDVRVHFQHRMGTITFMSWLPDITNKVSRGQMINEELVILVFRILGNAFGTSNVSSNFIPLILDFIQAADGRCSFRVLSEAMVLLDILVLLDTPSAMASFLNRDGAKTLVDLFGKEVSADVLSTAEEHAPLHSKVDYELSYYRVKWVKSFLVCFSNILNHKRTPTLINQLMNSNILDICSSIVDRPTVFGCRVVCLALQTISLMQDCEESTIATLAERGWLEPMISKIASLLNSNQHYFGPVLQFIEALGNSDSGVELIKSHNLITTFFTALSKSSLTEHESLYSVGNALEAFLSDRSDFLSPVVEQIVWFLGQVRGRLDEYISKGSGGASSQRPSFFVIESEGVENVGASKPAIIVQNVISMLHLVLASHKVMIEFINWKGLDPLLLILCHSSLPYDFILSREVSRYDGCLCSILHGLYALEYDTQYVLGTTVDALCKQASQTAAAIESFGAKGGQAMLHVEKGSNDGSMQILQNLSALTNLLWCLRSMAFTDYGTGYRAVLALETIETQVSLVPDIIAIQKFAAWNSASFFEGLDRNINLATWPIQVFDWSTFYSGSKLTREQRQNVKDAEVSETVQKFPLDELRHLKAARYVLLFSLVISRWLLSDMANFSSSNLALTRDKKRALKVADHVARGLKSLLEWLSLEDILSNPFCGRLTVFAFATTLSRCLFSRTGTPNLAVMTFFKQLGGFGTIFTIFEKLLLAPKSATFLYSLDGGEADLESESQAVLLDILKSLCDSDKILSSSSQTSELVTQGSLRFRSDFIDLMQFFTEMRIIVLSGFVNLLSTPELGRVRSAGAQTLFEILANLFNFTPSDQSQRRPRDFDREELPRYLMWEGLREMPEILNCFMGAGVNRQDAERELLAADFDIEHAFHALKDGKYRDLVFEECFKNPVPVVGDEMPVVDGLKRTLPEDVRYLKDKIRSELPSCIANLLTPGQEDVQLAIGILKSVVQPSPIADVHENVASFDPPNCEVLQEILRLLLKQGIKSGPRLCFISCMLDVRQIMEVLRESVPELSLQLWMMVSSDKASHAGWYAFALSTLEILVSRTYSVETPYGDLKTLDAMVISKTQPELREFIDKLGESYTSLDAVSVVATARFVVLLCLRAPLLVQATITSGLLKHFLQTVDSLAGSDIGKKLEFCTSCLICMAFESDEFVQALSRKKLGAWLDKYPREADIASMVHTLTPFIARDTKIFTQVFSELCCKPWHKETFFGLVDKGLAQREETVKVSQRMSEEPHLDGLLQRPPVLVDLQPVKFEGVGERQVDQGVRHALLKWLLKQLFTCGYTDAFRNLKSHVSVDSPINRDNSVMIKEEDELRLEASWRVYRKTANFTIYLLKTISELAKMTDGVKDNILAYQDNIVHSRLAGDSKFLAFVFRNYSAYGEAPGMFKDEVLSVSDGVCGAAQELVNNLINAPEDEVLSPENMQRYVTRTKIALGTVAEILASEFGVERKKHVPLTWWHYNLLHKMIDLCNYLLQKAESGWFKYSTRPILPSVFVEKKLIEVFSTCMGYVEMEHPEVSQLRGCLFTLLRRISEYDNKNFEHESNKEKEGDSKQTWTSAGDDDDSQDDYDTEESDEISDSEVNEEADMFPEVFDSEGAQRGEVYDSRAPNIFRNSALGLFEPAESDSRSSGERDDHSMDFEYDHVTDDEVLSDVDQEGEADSPQLDFEQLLDESESIIDESDDADEYVDEEHGHSLRVIGLEPENNSSGEEDLENFHGDTFFHGEADSINVGSYSDSGTSLGVSEIEIISPREASEPHSSDRLSTIYDYRIEHASGPRNSGIGGLFSSFNPLRSYDGNSGTGVTANPVLLSFAHIPSESTERLMPENSNRTENERYLIPHSGQKSPPGVTLFLDKPLLSSEERWRSLTTMFNAFTDKSLLFRESSSSLFDSVLNRPGSAAFAENIQAWREYAVTLNSLVETEVDIWTPADSGSWESVESSEGEREEEPGQGDTTVQNEERDQDTDAEIQNDISASIDPQFLAELPDDIRQEVFESYAPTLADSRRAEHSDNNNTGAREPEAAQGDLTDFFSTLDAHQRQEVVGDLASILGSARGSTSLSGLGSLVDAFDFGVLSVPASANMQRSLVQTSMGRLDRSGSSNDQQTWKMAPLKVDTGIDNWMPLFDKFSIASLMRHLYTSLSNSDLVEMLSVFEQLSENPVTRKELLLSLLHILHDAASLDHVSLMRGYEGLTCEAMGCDKSYLGETDIVSSQFCAKSSPAQVVSQALNLLSSWTRTVSTVAPLFFEPQEFSKPGDAVRLRPSCFLINKLLVLLDKPLIAENSAALAKLTKVILDLTTSFAEKCEGDADKRVTESQRGSDVEELPDEQEQGGSTESGFTNPSHVGDACSSADEDSSAPEPKQPTPQSSQPDIPLSNLERIFSVLTAKDCSALAFRNILGLLFNLSRVMDINDWLHQQFVRSARTYKRKIITELRRLQHCDESQRGSSLRPLTQFNSDQTKLLRILTAMEFLFDPTKSKTLRDSKIKQRYLVSMLKSVNSSSIWTELGKCIVLDGENNAQIATALLPLIECFTVVSKRMLSMDHGSTYTTSLQKALIEFALRHKKTLNHLVRNNPKLLSGSFAVLARDPRLLDFDNKQSYFYRKTKEEKSRLNPRYTKLKVRREDAFLDTYRSLFFKDAEEIKRADIEISFAGEEGVDAGGLSREWFQTLSKQIFNPDHALFVSLSADKTTFHPNRASWVNPEHLSFFKFIGRIIGKAVYDGRLMECYFSRAVYKHILQREVCLQDMEAVDEEYYKSLVWVLENDITEVITETFSVNVDDYGESTVVELKPGGAQIPVTEENKEEYVKLIVEYTLVKSVKSQLDQLSLGFSEIIPLKLLKLFDQKELELLICGLPDIDVDDWRNNTTYQHYTVNSPQIKWFWRAVNSFDQEERAKLLQFATGTSKVPPAGFSQLESSRGSGKFAILRDFGSSDRWPSAHTCTNQINLPLYESYDQLRTALMKAISEGNTGFGFA